jgi:hypothetical protein
MKLAKVFLMLIIITGTFFMISCSSDTSSTEPPDGDDALTEFYGTPTINPFGIFKDEPTDVTVRASIAVNADLVDDGITLVRVDAAGNVLETICPLYDNGALANGDEIIGDNVYSAIQNFILDSVGEYYYKVAAVTDDDGTEVTDYSETFTLIVVENNTDADFVQVSTVQEDVGDYFENNLNGTDIETALESTFNWVTSQPGVESAELVENGIRIEYENGIMGGIRAYQADENGEIDIKGWSANTDRNVHSRIHPALQTSGYHNGNNIRVEPDEDIIGNGDILIWAPFEAAFKTDMRPSLETIIESSDLDINLVTMADAECTVASVMNFTNYGIIIIDSHGSEGKEIGTGEQVNAFSFAFNYLFLLTGQVSIWQNVKVGYNGGVAVREDIFAVHDTFISALPGTFPNSLIFNGSCESSKNPNLKNAFIGKGAQTYFGFDKVVNTTFCKNSCDDIIRDVVVDFETTGDAFTAGQNDPQSPNALFEMFGNEDLHYSLDLINGDFEYGDLTGWGTTGDGRVINQLAYISPYEGSFMGIISTGLGYTESSGAIYQFFRVPEEDNLLTFQWNFMSEEFMEYVGSIYQDYFKVSIFDENGAEFTILYRDVDYMAENYGLSLISPDIVFDVGDVYGSGWLSYSYDLSAFAGEIVTIRFAAGDVGDSVYDTAILLDQIQVGPAE